MHLRRRRPTRPRCWPLSGTPPREQLAIEATAFRGLVYAVGNDIGPALLAAQAALHGGNTQEAASTLQSALAALGQSFLASKATLQGAVETYHLDEHDPAEETPPVDGGTAPPLPATGAGRAEDPVPPLVPATPNPPLPRLRQDDHGDERDPKRHEKGDETDLAAQKLQAEQRRQEEEAMALHLRQKQALAAGWLSPAAVGLAAEEFSRYVNQVFDRAQAAGVQCTLEGLMGLAPEAVDKLVAENGLREH
jgi:hypothetical protein